VERLILDVNGFDAIVFTKIESIVVLDFEFGGQWDIGVKRSRFAWDLEIKILAGFDDTEKVERNESRVERNESRETKNKCQLDR